MECRALHESITYYYCACCCCSFCWLGIETGRQKAPVTQTQMVQTCFFFNAPRYIHRCVIMENMQKYHCSCEKKTKRGRNVRLARTRLLCRSINYHALNRSGLGQSVQPLIGWWPHGTRNFLEKKRDDKKTK